MVGRVVLAHLPMLVAGFRLTVWLAILSSMASMILGTCVGLARVVPLRVLRAAGAAYVESFRNIPPLILLFFLYFALPKAGLVLDGFTCGLLGLSIYSAAFVAEAVRAGIQAIDKGQLDAARALGHGYLSMMRYIILPQAFTMILPPLGNIMIGLVKDTALVSTIGVEDLMLQGELVETRTFATFQVFTSVALFYLLVIAPLSIGVHALERRRATGTA